MKVIRVYRAEANMIRVDHAPTGMVADAIERYTYKFYDSKDCVRCPHYQDRHSEVCDDCESYLGTRLLGKVVTKGENKYLSVPLGGTKKLENLLSAYGRTPEYVEKHADGAPFRRPLLFVREARAWQLEALEKCLERKRGIIEAPPRSGKTILGVLLAAKIGHKTLIIASQREWLSQFMYSFIGKPDEPAFTNMSPKRIGFCKTEEDFERNDVCLASFQMFMSPKGKELLKVISRIFRVILIDECFTKDHEVLTDKGYVPITEVVESPESYKAVSFNHATGTSELKQVTKGIVKKTRQLVKITVNGEVFKCTPEHPWWSEDRQDYVKAKDIQVGEKIRLGDSS